MHIEAARGRRSYDAGLNIVPYIDMLMTLMVFLMITAVWQHTAVLDASSSSGGACPDCDAPKPAITAVLSSTGIALVPAEAQAERSLFRAGDVAGAVALLRRLGTPQTPLDVNVDDGVTFESVAAFMDAAKGAGFATQTLHSAPPN